MSSSRTIKSYNTSANVTTAAVVGLTTVAVSWWMYRRRQFDTPTKEAPVQDVRPHFELLSSELVPPISLDFVTQRETLSEVDEWLSKSSHWISFSIKFDTVLEYERVKLGLQRTKQHIPALAARIDSTSLLHQLVLDPQNCGVVLERVKGTFGAAQRLPGDTFTRKDWEFLGLNGPSAGYEGYPSMTDPLLRARVVTFEEAKCSYLCVGLSRALCDGHGMADLLQMWSHFVPTIQRPGFHLRCNNHGSWEAANTRLSNQPKVLRN